MPWQPGQSGNPNGPPKSAKIWKDALNRAIKRREDADPHAIEKLADKLLAAVSGGDVTAMKELGDRLDGKVPQGVGGTDELPPLQITEIVRKIVKPSDPNGGGVPPAVAAGPV